MPKIENLPSAKKRIFTIMLAVLIMFVSLLSILQVGVWVAHYSWSHWRPTYAKLDISATIERETLTTEDYQMLYEQTGLTKIGIDGLRNVGRMEQILAIQDAYFDDEKVQTESFGFFINMESVNKHIPLAELEDGDIIVSATTYLSFFRFGHSVLVVNAKKGLILESFDYSTLSELTDITSIDTLANLMVLRPKVDAQIRAKVAEYAQKSLVGIPYSIFAGILTDKLEEIPTITQCTHIVWHAYKKFGIDLDSNGGVVVLPRDIVCSDQVELVQTFWFDPIKLWS